MDVLVWTEVFGCGPIAGPVVKSYLAHHQSVLTVFGMPQDLEHVPEHPLVNRVVPTKRLYGVDAKSVMEHYRAAGHAGTSHLWAGLVRSHPHALLIHIDSDQVFVGNAVDDVRVALQRGAAIAGPRRPYRYNDNGRDDLRGLPDAVATFCFGFNTSCIPKWPRRILERAIRGRRISLRPVLDFFDPITLYVARNSGRVQYLDSPCAGPSATVQWGSPFLTKILAMPSASATGCALVQRGVPQRPTAYEKHALRSWEFYRAKLLGGPEQNHFDEFEEFSRSLDRLDRESWRLLS